MNGVSEYESDKWLPSNLCYLRYGMRLQGSLSDINVLTQFLGDKSRTKLDVLQQNCKFTKSI